MDRNKVIIIGLDGAAWDVIKPLMQDGKLPNLKYICENGVYGPLESLENAYTPTLWTSIVTGMMPDKHGVTNITSTDISLKCLRIWDILGKKGFKVGIFQCPVSWPVYEVNGFIIPSPFGRTTRAFPDSLSFIGELRKLRVFSQDMLKNMLKAKRHGLRTKTINEIIGYLFKEKILRREYKAWRYFAGASINLDIFLYLMRHYQADFSFYYFPYTDYSAHHFWKYYQPDKFDFVNDKEIDRYGRVIPDIYIKADTSIGAILSLLNDDDTIVIVSDHGTQAANKEEHKFLLDGGKFVQQINLQGTIEVSYLGSTTLLNKKADTEIHMEDIAEICRGVLIYEDNKPLFKVCMTETGAIALFLEGLRGVADINRITITLKGKRVKCKDILKNEYEENSGVHSPYGVFAIKGKGIRKGVMIEKIHVVDITPTLLHYLNYEIGEDMDGEVKMDIFVDKSPIRKIYSYDIYMNKEKEEVEKEYTMPEEVRERLKSLGYID